MKTILAILAVLALAVAGCSSDAPKEESKEFRDGQLCGEAALDRGACPYERPNSGTSHHNDDLYREWQRGYNDGLATKKILEKPAKAEGGGK